MDEIYRNLELEKDKRRKNENQKETQGSKKQKAWTYEKVAPTEPNQCGHAQQMEVSDEQTSKNVPIRAYLYGKYNENAQMKNLEAGISAQLNEETRHTHDMGRRLPHNTINEGKKMTDDIQQDKNSLISGSETTQETLPKRRAYSYDNVAENADKQPIIIPQLNHSSGIDMEDLKQDAQYICKITDSSKPRAFLYEESAEKESDSTVINEQKCEEAGGFVNYLPTNMAPPHSESMLPFCGSPQNVITDTGKEYIKHFKKLPDSQAEFYYSDGNLCAMLGGEKINIGNFCLDIIEEKTIVSEVVNEANEIVGHNETVMWHMKIITGSAVFTDYIANEKIFKPTWIRESSKGRANWEDSPAVKKLLCAYIHQLITAEQHRTIIEFLSCGWKWMADGKAYYLTSAGAIGHKELSVRAKAGFDLHSQSSDMNKNFARFLGMRQITSGNPGNAVFLQYYLIAALMTALYKKSGHQIEFSLALIGKTNTKKTSCGEIFTRVFNRTNSAVPDINFSATDAAIYEIMERYADAVVMIDDLTPSENDVMAREKQKKLENIIRAYGDRVPRRRSVTFSDNKDAKEFIPPNGCALLTGEVFSGGKSSRSRVIKLRFEEGDVDNMALSFYQQQLQILPDFVYDFLKYVSQNIERVMLIISNECVNTREEVGGAISLPRYADAYGTLCAATAVLYDYITLNQLMNQGEASVLLQNDRQLILNIIQENDAELSTIAPGVIVMQALKNSLEHGQIKRCKIEDVTEFTTKNQVLEDIDFYYIMSETLWYSAKLYADYRKIYFPYKCGRDLIPILKEEGLILQKKEGSTLRSSHKLMLGGRVCNHRFLYLHKKVVEKIWNELEQY